LGISYNAAWRLKHKRMQAMKERDNSQPLSGNVQMDDACLGGERLGGSVGAVPPASPPLPRPFRPTVTATPSPCA